MSKVKYCLIWKQDDDSELGVAGAGCSYDELVSLCRSLVKLDYKYIMFEKIEGGVVHFYVWKCMGIPCIYP